MIRSLVFATDREIDEALEHAVAVAIGDTGAPPEVVEFAEPIPEICVAPGDDEIPE